MDRERYMDSIFEFADTYTHDVDVDEYEDFLWHLFQRVAKGMPPDRCIWKEDHQISFEEWEGSSDPKPDQKPAMKSKQHKAGKRKRSRMDFLFTLLSWKETANSRLRQRERITYSSKVQPDETKGVLEKIPEEDDLPEISAKSFRAFKGEAAAPAEAIGSEPDNADSKLDKPNPKLDNEPTLPAKRGNRSSLAMSLGQRPTASKPPVLEPGYSAVREALYNRSAQIQTRTQGSSFGRAFEKGKQIQEHAPTFKTTPRRDSEGSLPGW
jgi:hypothetical protein